MFFPLYTIWYDDLNNCPDYCYADTTVEARSKVLELRRRGCKNIEIWLTTRITDVTKDVMGEY